ncbi:MAG TPA: DinB family protein [Candidatus Dormibacteraeota bacterium]|nr:DinB family protein [Candidatus Dormibacteraeota bacterium]
MSKSRETHAGVNAESYAARLPLALLNAFDTNDRINHYLIENLPPEAWRAKPPGEKGRTIAAIVAHMHNVRVMWLKAAKSDDIPEQLERATVGPAQAKRGLESSHRALRGIIHNALDTDGRIRGFRPDVVGFIGYLIAHDAHHRGQIAMLARQIGHPLPQKATFGMWEWGSR